MHQQKIKVKKKKKNDSALLFLAHLVSHNLQTLGMRTTHATLLLGTVPASFLGAVICPVVFPAKVVQMSLVGATWALARPFGVFTAQPALSQPVISLSIPFFWGV